VISPQSILGFRPVLWLALMADSVFMDITSLDRATLAELVIDR
ncbi:unnamed protein product, partial [Acidithrix sp. C25]